MSESLDVDRLAEKLALLTDALTRLNATLDKLEEARVQHAEIVGKLTDERFRTVTR